MTDFDREVDAAVFGALNPKEELLWTGHCMSRLGKQQRTESYMPFLRVIPIGLCVVGAFVAMYAITIPEFSGLLTGIGVFLGAVWMKHRLDSGHFHDSKMYCRKQTAYALTNQRAFVLKRCHTDVPMRSVDWRYVDEVRAEVVEPSGRGTVMFRRWDPGARRWDTLLRFYKIADAHQVADLAQGAMTQANR
jgi:hypothetical protein